MPIKTLQLRRSGYVMREKNFGGSPAKRHGVLTKQTSPPQKTKREHTTKREVPTTRRALAAPLHSTKQTRKKRRSIHFSLPKTERAHTHTYTPIERSLLSSSAQHTKDNTIHNDETPNGVPWIERLSNPNNKHPHSLSSCK